MTLLDGEKVLFEAKTGDLLLTTHRVRYGREETDFTSIMVEEICSIGVAGHAHRWMAFTACVVFLASVMLAGSLGMKAMSAESVAATSGFESSAWKTFLGGVIVGGVFLVAYLVTRHRVVVLASAATDIEWVVPRTGSEYVAGFVDQVEMAKDRRFMLQAQAAEREPDTAVAASGRTSRAGA